MKKRLINAFLYGTVFFVKITGKIVYGAGRGKRLGFPTINVDAPGLRLEFGVYAAWVELKGDRYRGAMSFGPRPTFDDMQPVLEVFLLDYSGEIYCESVILQVVKRIRDIQKFDTTGALKMQIEADVVEVRRLLAGA